MGLLAVWPQKAGIGDGGEVQLRPQRLERLVKLEEGGVDRDKPVAAGRGADVHQGDVDLRFLQQQRAERRRGVVANDQNRHLHQRGPGDHRRNGGGPSDPAGALGGLWPGGLRGRGFRGRALAGLAAGGGGDLFLPLCGHWGPHHKGPGPKDECHRSRGEETVAFAPEGAANLSGVTRRRIRRVFCPRAVASAGDA